MMKKYLIPSTVILAVAAFAGYFYWSSNRPTGDAVSSDSSENSPAFSQPSLPQPNPNAPNMGFPFLDTSMLKPPTGSKVAIFVFEDLECPACAHAFPVVRTAVERYKIPLVRHDFPLTEIHIWSFDAAVTARYLQDHVSPKLADAFRGDVFAHQNTISNKDDLDTFTRAWFQSHGQTMPFVIDAGGACSGEVKADRALGDRLGIHSTPCILVVTQSKWVQVTDVRQLDQIIDTALSEA